MIKSKRGRKPKIKPSIDISNIETNNEVVQTEEVINLPKKRGRKPKGGKIIQTTQPTDKMIHTMPNIILHLHCTIEDVNNTFNGNNSYNPNVISVENYSNDDNFFKNTYTIVNNSCDIQKIDNELVNDKDDTYFNKISNINNFEEKVFNKNSNSEEKPEINTIESETTKVTSKQISKKLKELSYKLRNNICENKSACFWCTCKFNTGNIYIPKNVENENINVYGCFCSPECATSYLMSENIDSSIKFERYSLLNYIYGSIYKYEKNIKPAPCPYYTLDKFCGNLSIEEYRSHFTDDNLLIIANKPHSRILPELFEENNMSTNDMRYSINKYA